MLRFPALEIVQGQDRTLYSFAVDGKLLSQITTVSRVHRGEKPSIAGYQRPEMLSHIAEIRVYLESERPMIPNAVVIAFDHRVQYAFRDGTLRTVAEVFDQVLSFACPLVELTGGEPLLQSEAFALMTALANAGKTVLLETSGVVSIRGVDSRVHVIMDLKCPDSGECENNVWENLALLKPTDQIKLVIASRRDFDWTVSVIREHSLDQRFIVLLSSVFGRVSPRELADWLLDSGLDVRMQLQMHKFIWDPNARGV